MNKIAFLVLLIMLVIETKAQEKERIEFQIDSLESINKSISEQQKMNNVTLNVLRDKLLRIKYNNIQLPNIEIETNSEINIFSEPNLASYVKGVLPKKSKITVLGYESGFYMIDSKGEKGYAHYSTLPTDERLLAYKTQGMVQENEKKEKKEKEELELKKKREVAIIKEFGTKNGKRILNGEIWLGMTSSMAIESIGVPKEKNRTIGSWGEHEQWVYEYRYLYFENDILKSWQD